MLEVRNISKSYGTKKILENVSFLGNAGERIVIVGRNGCGKTTLLNILAGIQKPDSGTLRYAGKEPLKEPRVFVTVCGYVPQNNALMEALSVEDNLRLWGYSRKHPDRVILEQFHLEELLKTKVSRLSGGMKRRVSIACATFGHPSILFLDEPTTALDLYYKKDINDWLKLYQSRGGLVIMTTHEKEEIQQASRCLVMKDGMVTEAEVTDHVWDIL